MESFWHFSCLDGYFKFMNVENKILQSIFLQCISKYGLCQSEPAENMEMVGL